MKKILFLSSFLISAETKAYFLSHIPVVNLAEVNAESPIVEMHEYCDRATFGGGIGAGIGSASGSFGWGWRNCMRIAYRPDAEYGQKFMIIMDESTAKDLYRDKGRGYKDNYNPYDWFPNPIQVVAVPDADYHLSDGPIPYPPDGYLTKTDPDIGKKMLYCQGSIAVCGLGGALLWEATGFLKAMGFLKFCSRGPEGACSQFRDAWIKEHKALEEMEDWNTAHGVSRTPFDKWFREVFSVGSRPTPTGGEGSGTSHPAGTGGGAEGGVLEEHCYKKYGGIKEEGREDLEWPDVTCYYF